MTLSLSSLIPVKGARKKKLLGRGAGSGHGKQSTRGHKGQRARSGRDFYLGFEGGQSPLIRRIPKRGFTHINKNKYQLVNIQALKDFAKDSIVDGKALEEKGLIRNSGGWVKILGQGDLVNALTIKANKFSKNALQRIQKAGGKAEVIQMGLIKNA